MLLTRFIDANQSALERGAWPALERLLTYEDDVLWARLQSPPTGAGDEAELLGAIRSGRASDD